MRIKIVIADDHPLCRSGFSKVLNIPEFQLMGQAENGKELIDLARKFKPDIIITDIKMPIIDGVEAAKQIHKEFPTIGIIAISLSNEYCLITKMLEAGAKGYLLKDTSINEIINAVYAVQRGETYYCKETTEEMVQMLGQHNSGIVQNKNDSQFSEQEMNIIKFICVGDSNKEIAQQLHLNKRTVEWYREKILKKIKAKNTANIVSYAIKNNLWE